MLPLVPQIAFNGAARSFPFLGGAHLARAHVNANRAEIGGALLAPSACENVALPWDLDVDESGAAERNSELCVQQSASDSAGPKINLAFG